MTDRCDFTDLPVDQCSHCRPKPTGQNAMSAQYSGECELCWGPINVGDWITVVGEGLWVHRRCAR